MMTTTTDKPLPWPIIEETLRGIHARSETTSTILGFVYDSQTGRGKVRVGDFTGTNRIKFSVIDGMVYYASARVRPTVY